ncbi:response regulator [Egbenema bharatensis]|uniref:response regulator n=1 Tax=Egbenema bharatensis TaxID=3463334 RepID=UPI003A8A5C98
MNDDRVNLFFQKLQQQIEVLQTNHTKDWQEIEAVLENLQVTYEQLQSSLAAAEVVREELLQQSQQITADYYHYYNLFQLSPIAYLVTDSDGVILEANQTIAHLLGVPQRYLPGKPMVLYVAEDDRTAFRTNLNQLSFTPDPHGLLYWQVTLSPRSAEPFRAELHVAILRNESGLIESLRIGVYNLSRYQQQVDRSPQLPPEAVQTRGVQPQLPQSLDGLQILLVDDEADAREFITAVLESYGVGVRAVDSAAAALEELKQFRPDVLMSDIRLPGSDGYSLIRQIRALEVEQGGHLPAAAITAYLDEDRARALTAGFEAHLYKLSQPSEWVEVVARLAGREWGVGSGK